MKSRKSSVKRTLVVRNKLGLHLRAAHLIASAASQFESDIAIKKGADVCNGKSSLELMLLAAVKGEKVEVRIQGDDAREAIAAIEQLFKHKFGEE